MVVLGLPIDDDDAEYGAGPPDHVEYAGWKGTLEHRAQYRIIILLTYLDQEIELRYVSHPQQEIKSEQIMPKHS